MKKCISLILALILLLTLTAAFAAEDSLGGTPTNAAEINYAFAWSAERYEQSAPLTDKADLHLTLVRKEWESFQLLVKTAAPDQAVTVEITPFANETGDTFEAKVYLVGYEAGEDGGAYPKTLTAADGTPAVLTAGLTQSFLVEVCTTADNATGSYSAVLTMKDASGAVLLEKEITAEVYPVNFPTMPYVEASMGKKGKLPELTGTAAKTFLGYAGYSYDYFRVALEVFGEDWLNEHFNNIVTDIAAYADDVEFFATMRPKLARLLSGDVSEFHTSVEHTLQFGEDGKFTILVMADMHYGGNHKKVFTAEIAEYYSTLIESYDPDLIVLLGDNIHSEEFRMNAGTAALAYYMDGFMAYFEQTGIPVAMVYGNHEYSSAFAPHKLMQFALYQMYDCFVGEIGPEMSGVGNYNLPILSSDGSRTAFNLWMIDSGANNIENDLGGYACVGKDQIAWYVQTSNELKEANGGEAVPSILFQHIIVPEIFDVLVSTDSGFGWELPENSTGWMHEMPGSPLYTNGQFAAMVEQGDVIATVHGHEHDNCFIVPYQGIDIVNTLRESEGVRIIELDESNPWNYETFIVKPSDLGLKYVEVAGDV